MLKNEGKIIKRNNIARLMSVKIQDENDERLLYDLVKEFQTYRIGQNRTQTVNKNFYENN